MINTITKTATKSVTNKIIAINLAVFILTSIIPGLTGALALYNPFSPEFNVWQIITHMFTHSGLMHIFFNMLVLWQFGNIVENEMNRYFKYESKWLYTKTYIGFGLVAALLHIIMLGGASGAMVGASGAIAGVFAVYCLLYPQEKVYLYFLLPIKCIYMLYAYVGIELFCALFSHDNVGHWAHLGGILAGFLFWVFKFKKLQF